MRVVLGLSYKWFFFSRFLYLLSKNCFSGSLDILINLFSPFLDIDHLIWGLSCYVVIQGAGGMHMVDPLFQRVLVNECRSRKIPVIFDEVFTGFWRLGVEVISLSDCYSLIYKTVFHIVH